MRKAFLLLIAAAFAVSIYAQKLCIWREGGKLYELQLQVNDSLTFEMPDTSVVPVAPGFDYDHWREQTTIDLYSHGLCRWQTINLPWADVAVTTMPKAYRFPCNELNADSVPKWELAFNLFPDSTLDGVHMFGLWDKKGATMRIYSYNEEAPNQNAKYCFFEVVSSHSSFIERDAMTWMPSDSIIKNHNWNTTAIPEAAAQPNSLWCQVMPIAGTLDGQINRGWLCFDLNFSCGAFSVPEDGTLSFTLYGVQDVDLAGTASFNMVMHSDSSLITVPGNKNKAAAGYISAGAGAVSGITSAIAQAVSLGEKAGFTGGLVDGLFGVAGALFSMAGGFQSADEEGDSKQYKLDMNFHGKIDGQFNGQLTSTLPTTISPVSVNYATFFGDVLNNQPKANGGSVLANANADDSAHDSLTVGIWNLKSQPVLYVCNDGYFHTIDGEYALLSFLDPTSIELLINQNSTLFEANEIDSIKLVAYDFAFVDAGYNMPAQKYYNFYRIPQSTLPAMGHFPRLISYTDKSDFLLDQQATTHTFGKGNYSYAGVYSDALEDGGLGVYNMVYSPAIMPDTSYFSTRQQTLSDIGVAVVVELVFKSGDRRLFSERFLPQIKTFSFADAAALKTRFQYSTAPTYIDGIHLEHKLFEKQKQKAIRLLNAELYPMVTIDENNYRYGIQVKPYQDAQNPGIVVETRNDDPGIRYWCATLEGLYQYLNTIDCLQSFDQRMDYFGLPPFTYGLFPTKKEGTSYVIGSGCQNTTGGKYILIYNVDANGNLTLQQE